MNGADEVLRVWTIGHSTREQVDFIGLLRSAGIQTLADIRRFPGSRSFPQFNQDALKESLWGEGIGYQWIESLGGRRRGSKGANSPNAGLRNAAFRSYADYMATPEFEAGVRELLSLAAKSPTAMMCAEAVYWRCHRRLVSDSLTARGVQVLHIMDAGPLRPHELTPGAVVRDGRVSYPATEEPTMFEE